MGLISRVSSRTYREGRYLGRMKIEVRTVDGKKTNIEIDKDANVLDLKKNIELNHDYKPTVVEQKLISRGKLGRNDQTVEVFLEGREVIHLICPNTTPEQRAADVAKQTTSTSSSSKADTQTPPEVVSSSTKPEVRFRYHRTISKQEQERRITDEIVEFMRYKGPEKRPYLNIRVTKDGEAKIIEPEPVPDINNNIERPPRPANPAPAAPAAPAPEEEGFRVDDVCADCEWQLVDVWQYHIGHVHGETVCAR